VTGMPGDRPGIDLRAAFSARTPGIFRFFG